MTDRYCVCTACGHYWSSPYPPDDRRCESCARAKVVTSAGTLEKAEAMSERVLDEGRAVTLTPFDAIFPLVAVRLRRDVATADRKTRFAAGTTVLVRGLVNPGNRPASGCTVEVLRGGRRIEATLRDLHGAEVLDEIPL